MKDEGNIQHKGNCHHQTIEYLKLVIEKLLAKSKKLPSQLQQKKYHKTQAQEMKHLQQSIIYVARW